MYVIKQGAISFKKISFRQISHGVGLSGPDITGLALDLLVKKLQYNHYFKLLSLLGLFYIPELLMNNKYLTFISLKLIK